MNKDVEERLLPREQKSVYTQINEKEEDEDNEEAKARVIDNPNLNLANYKLIELVEDAWMLQSFESLKRKTKWLVSQKEKKVQEFE